MNYSNLAYELPDRYESDRRNNKHKINAARARRTREQMLIRRKNLRRICVILTLAASAGFMISRFVAVNETQQQVAALEKELSAAESVTSQMVFDMERSVDLATIEKEATTRLGMQRPEKYQTVYVNVKQDDMTEKTASEVEGPGKRIMSWAKKLISNIVNFFSIK